MTPIRSHAGPGQRLALVLVALALLVRVAIPQGWMPVAQADGFGFAICSGSGPAAGWVDLDGSGEHKPDKSAHDHPCAFAGMSAPLLGGADVSVALPAPAVAAIPSAAHLAAAIGHGLAAPPPPSTGPPALI